MASVVVGDVVAVQLSEALEDGTVVDQTEADAPLFFIAGSDEVIEGLSEAVVGMSVGEKKRVVLSPEKAHGEFDPELRYSVPRSDLPDDVQVNDELMASEDEDDDEEEAFSVWVVELSEDEAVIDHNHPLAGKTVVLEIELISIGDDEGWAAADEADDEE